jgi:DNA-binding response OmpR family regulator
VVNGTSVLVCEDDEDLLEILVDGLTRQGFAATGVPDGRALDSAYLREPPHIVVLDIGLPGEDGFAVARRLRRLPGPPVGIIVVSARAALEDRLQGLMEGADAYLTKPVDLKELGLAIRNLRRRLGPEPQPPAPAPAAGYSLDPLRSQLVLPSFRRVDLTATELQILRLLAQCPGAPVERHLLLRHLQYPEDLLGIQRLEAAVSRLRAKIRTCEPGLSLPLRARHGSGYAFLAPLGEVP